MIQLERRGNTYIFSAARLASRYASIWTWTATTSSRPVRLCRTIPRSSNKRFQQRSYHSSRQGRFRTVSRLHRHALELLDVQSGARSSSPLRGAIRSAQLDRDGPRFSSTERQRRDDGPSVSLRSCDAHAALVDTGANRHNNDHVLSFDGTMLGISDQTTRHRLDDFYCPRRRHAEAHHTAHAVLSAQLVTRWQVPGLHRRTQRQFRYLQLPPTAAAKNSPDELPRSTMGRSSHRMGSTSISTRLAAV